MFSSSRNPLRSGDLIQTTDHLGYDLSSETKIIAKIDPNLYQIGESGSCPSQKG